MLQQATDVPAGSLGKVGVGAFAEEERLVVVPEALVHVHAAAVVGEDRLGHEGGRFAILLGDVAHHVLVDHHVVSCADQFGKFDAELVLGRGHFVVLLLDRNPEGSHGEEHLAADVLQSVVGSNWEIALLQQDLISEVAALLDAIDVPGGLGRIHLVEAATITTLVAHIIEDEEFRFRTEIGLGRDAGAGQVIERLLGQGARAAAVGLAAAGLLDRADQAEGLVAVKGVDPGGIRIRHHRHVRLVDGFPTADRGTVERHAVGEGAFIDQIVADREVLPFAVQVDEFQIDQFDSLVLDLTENVVRCLGHEGVGLVKERPERANVRTYGPIPKPICSCCDRSWPCWAGRHPVGLGRHPAQPPLGALPGLGFDRPSLGTERAGPAA